MAFISDNANFHTYEAKPHRGRVPYYRQLMIVSISLIAIATQGCSMNNNMIEEHERICKQNMKVIVHDNDLWREYRAQSAAAYQREIQETPPMTGRTYYTPVGDFDTSFGKNKSHFRPNVDDKIVRDDIFITKGDKVVAQIVDYIYQYRSIDGPTGFNCLKFYKDLSVGGVDQ
ncbi:hypothetical protein N5J77_00565 [Sphingobium yanoikuyae]|jgi:hypothetical protein|uniref:Uncharacterized protein n=1 Tax=Sphingobium yanoikuyae TaxID=13690 RepID=A0AA43B9U3_SPHYA|nr:MULTISPECIES: hypothetical protein [Sphingobium]MBV2150323.1 hypothetical protein [Sphingobium sp. AS12]MDH2129599.1 hypothetical protein [Sphingobium yanoikuyae]MDH2148696.1 hypothetical protein [Sphingobium yanoikuyae]MDH2165483.1 hypothetical protein [Sphingobium yanoikuyae]QWT14262.1 hypothetical protein GTV57_00140 [Sphingobium xenophagum]|tara:strand:- start:3115 stop:3633 length:519 start_codon:yes stop_codon:yes gene_type:complete